MRNGVPRSGGAHRSRFPSRHSSRARTVTPSARSTSMSVATMRPVFGASAQKSWPANVAMSDPNALVVRVADPDRWDGQGVSVSAAPGPRNG